MGPLAVNPRFFHVYQDTPRGREALIQTCFFCRMLGAAPVIYIPETHRFLMYFENRVVQVDLDLPKDWARERHVARRRAEEILADAGLDGRFLEVRHRTTPSLPDIPVDFDFMACPVPMDTEGWPYSDLGMRRLPAVAPFPIFMPAIVARPWKRIVVCYGGSPEAEAALHLAFGLAAGMDCSLDVFGLGAAGALDAALEKAAGKRIGRIENRIWREKEAEAWMHLPSDALLVLGASGGSWFRERMFPSFKKCIRRTLSLPMLFVGPEERGRGDALHPDLAEAYGSLEHGAGAAGELFRDV